MSAARLNVSIQSIEIWLKGNSKVTDCKTVPLSHPFRTFSNHEVDWMAYMLTVHHNDMPAFISKKNIYIIVNATIFPPFNQN